MIDGNQYGWTPIVAPHVDAKMTAEIVKRGHGATEEQLRAASPVAIDWPDKEVAWRTLDALYEPDEILFVGIRDNKNQVDGTVRPVEDWIEILKREGCAYSHFVANPLTGARGTTEDGKPTYLARECVASHRFATVELDSLSRDQQLAFWSALPHLPIAAITHTGEGALQVLVRVDAVDAAEWDGEVAVKLFDQILVPLGVDARWKSAVRFACLPGHRRAETGLHHKLFYFAPTGKAVVHAP
jgi:hypothetical protein